MRKLNILSTFIAVSFVTTTSFAGLLDKDVDYATLPPEVQQAITQYAQGGTIESIEERLTKEDDLKVYKVEVKKADGTEIEFEVDAAGKLIELEKD